VTSGGKSKALRLACRLPLLPRSWLQIEENPEQTGISGERDQSQNGVKTGARLGLSRAGTRDPVCSCWKSELGSERAARPAGSGGSVKDRSSRGWGGLSGPSQFLVWIESRGQAGLVNLISELIRPSCSWIQFDLMGGKPPSGRLVPHARSTCAWVSAISFGRAPAELALSRALDPTHGFHLE
jgi:hypothetical protein